MQVWQTKEENDREDFRSILQGFIRLYGFVSQLITFEDVDLEKLYVYARSLNRKLPKREGRLPYEIQDSVDLDSFRIDQTFQGQIPLMDEEGEVPGISTGRPHHTDDEKDVLSHIIQVLNETHGLGITDEDKIDLERIRSKLEVDEGLRAVMTGNNTIDNMRMKFEKVVDDLLLDFVHTKLDLYKKLTEPKANALFKNRWFEGYHRQLRNDLEPSL